ncbi:Cox family DNA-binding protein [Aeromonas jandaei]
MRAEASSQAQTLPAKLVHRGCTFRPELTPPPGHIPSERFGELHGMANDAVMLACRQDGKFPYTEMRSPLNPAARAKVFINMFEWNSILETAFTELPKIRRIGFLAWLGFDPDNLPEVVLCRPQFDSRSPWSDVLTTAAFAELMGMSKAAVDKMCDKNKLPYIEMKIPGTGVHATRFIYMPAWNGAMQMAFELQSAERGRPYEAWVGIPG